jgi:hypothetical protein
VLLQNQPKEEQKNYPAHSGLQKLVVETSTNVDHLDDGYTWRKYGQKVVKGSPYPRSYYRCTEENCPVKKQVELRESTVVNIYEGTHNHLAPASRDASDPKRKRKGKPTTTTSTSTPSKPATVQKLENEPTAPTEVVAYQAPSEPYFDFQQPITFELMEKFQHQQSQQ